MWGQSWWEEQRYGLLVSTSLAAVPAWAPVGQTTEWYGAHLDGDTFDVLLQPSPMVETLAHHRERWGHVATYDDFLPLLTFDEYDPQAWAALAKAAGMSYAVMVAKHHDGLCWWDAPKSDRTVLHDGPRRNVLADFAAACEQTGLTFGASYSLLDWSDDRYPSRRYVDEVLHPQVLDLVDRYGARLLWGDGHWGRGGDHWRTERLIAEARRTDPGLIVNDRWWLERRCVYSFDQTMPNRILTDPWELRRGIGPSFGFNRAERPEHLRSPRELVALLTEVVAKGGHLLVGVGPDALGRFPDTHVAVLRDAGEWVQQHRQLIDHGRPWHTWGDADCRYLLVDGDLQVIDVSDRGAFAALDPSVGIVRNVARVEDGGVVDFVQGDDGTRVFDRSAAASPRVYRIELDEPPARPVELFPQLEATQLDLVAALGSARPGQIVQLGEGTYRGPAYVPDGVTVRGLGADRTVINGGGGCAVTLGRGSRLEHCTVRGGGRRIIWLPRVVVRIDGAHASLLACRLDGHVDIAADDARVTSCTATGVVARRVHRAVIARSTLRGIHWDTAIEIHRGSGHVIESCDIADVLEAVHLVGTVGATVRGNHLRARWWGVRAIDSEATVIAANLIERSTRAVDVDGGSQTSVAGNVVTDGDSGCIVQRGAVATDVIGNRWERCRIGLLAWDAGAVRARDNAAIDLDQPDAAVTIGP